ncbi:hypothetical protein G6F66_015218 [Rhizopus arrhizus]|nr:hypothetical protein G6F66_015218 [Rhizopus arrhizus]
MARWNCAARTEGACSDGRTGRAAVGAAPPPAVPGAVGHCIARGHCQRIGGHACLPHRCRPIAVGAAAVGPAKRHRAAVRRP